MSGRHAFTVFVRNIPWTVNRKVLKDHFTEFGTVKEINYPLNKETGFYKRYAFIKMKDRAGMERVLNHEEHVIDHARVFVMKEF